LQCNQEKFASLAGEFSSYLNLRPASDQEIKLYPAPVTAQARTVTATRVDWGLNFWQFYADLYGLGLYIVLLSFCEDETYTVKL